MEHFQNTGFAKVRTWGDIEFVNCEFINMETAIGVASDFDGTLTVGSTSFDNVRTAIDVLPHEMRVVHVPQELTEEIVRIYMKSLARQPSKQVALASAEKSESVKAFAKRFGGGTGPLVKAAVDAFRQYALAKAKR